jgi:hypothetical protein
MSALDTMALVGASTVGAASAAINIISDMPTAGQNWTILGMLGAMIFIVGKRTVDAIDRNGERTAKAIEAAQAHNVQLATALIALQSEVRELRSDGDERKRQIMEAIEHITNRSRKSQ